jgi:hypothetical protein
MGESDDDLARNNLDAWRASGVVKTLKHYTAEDAGVCAERSNRHGSITAIGDAEVGVNLPPVHACSNGRCRCYFRPWDISSE